MDTEPEIAIDLSGASAPDDLLPVLNEAAPPMDLPERATLNADGSVTLQFEFPCVLNYTSVGGGLVKSEAFDHLVLNRLRGPDWRKIIEAKNGNTAALARSAGLSPAKLNLLLTVMDSADVGAAGAVVTELLGGLKDGMPAHAEETEDGIKLPLMYPSTDAEGTVHSELLFRRMTGADRIAVSQAKAPLDWAVHRATGLSPKVVKGLIDDMDAADIAAVQEVVSFLSGNGRRTGR